MISSDPEYMLTVDPQITGTNNLKTVQTIQANQGNRGIPTNELSRETMEALFGKIAGVVSFVAFVPYVIQWNSPVENTMPPCSMTCQRGLILAEKMESFIPLPTAVQFSKRRFRSRWESGWSVTALPSPIF